MTCLIYTTLLVIAAVCQTDSTKLYHLNNVFYNMYFCTNNNNGELGTTVTNAGTHDCAITKFNILPYNNGLVLMYKHDSACKHLCLNKCGKLYNNDKYVPDECTWTTMAFQDIDTLSQNRGNHTQFLAFASYYWFEFYASDNFRLHSYHQNIQLHITEVTGTQKDVCVLNPKNIGAKATCIIKTSDARIDMHKDYASITLFDKLLAFLGFYEIKQQKTDHTLRYIDYSANFPK